MDDNKVAVSLFDQMVAKGDELMETQRLEERLALLCSRRSGSQDLAAWKDARRRVEILAGEYAAAVHQWRVDLELRIHQELPAFRRRPQPLPS